MGKKKHKKKKGYKKDYEQDPWYIRHFAHGTLGTRLVYIGISALLVLLSVYVSWVPGFIIPLGALYIIMQSWMAASDFREWLDFRLNLPDIPVRDLSRTDKVIGHLASAFIFLGMLIPIFQARHLGNTFDAWTLVFRGMLAGLVPGVLVLVLFRLISRSTYHNSYRRYYIILGTLFGFATMTATAGSYINFRYADETPSCSYQQILDREARESDGTWTYMLLVNTVHGTEERIYVSERFYESIDPYDELEYCLRTGRFGFDFLEGYYLPEK